MEINITSGWRAPSILVAMKAGTDNLQSLQPFSRSIKLKFYLPFRYFDSYKLCKFHLQKSIHVKYDTKTPNNRNF